MFSPSGVDLVEIDSIARMLVQIAYIGLIGNASSMQAVMTIAVLYDGV